MKCIQYKSGYKYQLVEDYELVIEWGPPADIRTRYIDFIYGPHGHLLKIRQGYASDGPSGLSIDTPSFMRGAFVHDAMYQMIREGFLEPTFKDLADRLLQSICIEDGMWKIRAWWVYQAVRLFGKNAIEPNGRHVIVAPKGCHE